MTVQSASSAFGAGSLGSPVRRVEDGVLLTGQGTYVANLNLDGVLDAVFVRSTYAHARIVALDVSVARTMPGVVTVLTAADLEDVPHVTFVPPANPVVARWGLVRDRVRHVGDPVALVLAASKRQAMDAVEAVVVDYEPLPAVTDMEKALADGAPTLFEEIGSNVFIGERDANFDEVLAGAEVVVRGRFVNQRLAVAPIECNVITVVPGEDGDGHKLTIHVATQFPHMFQRLIASALSLPADSVRVIVPHVGGSFGGKLWPVEHSIVLGASRLIERPVRWVESRSESLAATTQGRGQIQYVELGLLRDGSITGLRCRVLGDAGAYGGFGGSLAMSNTRTMVPGAYQIPKFAYDVAVVLTNTPPPGAYRGAGRPEAAALIERIVDMAADQLDIDPAELRRRNLVPSAAFPFTTITGATYDSGDYALALDEALRVARYEELRAEQAERRSRADRMLLGIGIALYVEITGGTASEFADVRVHEDGTATVLSGASAHGQGHATTFSVLVADRLGIPLDSIRFVQSDTALVPRGGGTGGSRSGQVGGSAVLGAAEAVLEQARALAASLLEADPEDIVQVPGGGLGVAGVPSLGLSWADLGKAAAERREVLRADFDFTPSGPTFPFGAHVCAVEVDSETGLVRVLRHIAVDDCGRIMNPLIVQGQVHGGLASGIAQALWEEVAYDEDGNPVTSTFADYAIPSAAELPSFELAHTETLSPHNPLGAKGIGESATVGSTPAAQNAVVDALSHLGVCHIDMPCTPERVSRAIQDALTGSPPDSGWREPPNVFATLPVRGGGDVEDINI